MKKLLFISLVLIFASCEDKIDIKLDEGTSQLAIDAFITNKPGVQKIRLTKTSGYFNNAASPAATGASVKITDNNTGAVYTFVDSSLTGNYIWSPAPTDTLKIGDEFTLSVIYSGEQFTATSNMNPSPIIDSISYVYKAAAPSQGQDSAGYFASFWGSDFPETTDFYWIKSYKNGVLNSKPGNINTAWDAAFGPGANGFPFILPIRDAITQGNSPFKLNDSVTVEIHAITKATFDFLLEVRTQTTNGGLFATPPANVSTNIKNVNPSSKIKAVGFFNVGAVSTLGKRIK